MHDRRPVLESLPSVCCWGCLECDSQSKSTDIRLIFEFFTRCSICCEEKPKKKIREWILVYKLLDHCKFSWYKPYTLTLKIEKAKWKPSDCQAICEHCRSVARGPAFPASRGRQCGNCVHPLLSFSLLTKKALSNPRHEFSSMHVFVFLRWGCYI